MFCEKCGTPNNDNNTVCTNCGAPLRHIPFDGYPQQGQPPQYQQMPPYQQPPYYPQQPGNGTIAAHRRPTALYIIAGVLALLQFFLIFLPHVAAYGRSYNFFGILSEIFGMGRTANYYYNSNTANAVGAVVVFLLILFIVPMALQIVWAILSFLQKRPAGIFGVIASSVYLISSCVWLIVLAASLSSNTITAVPLLMILFAVAGIPVSIVQIVKKKYL